MDKRQHVEQFTQLWKISAHIFLAEHFIQQGADEETAYALQEKFQSKDMHLYGGSTEELYSKINDEYIAGVHKALHLALKSANVSNSCKQYLQEIRRLTLRFGLPATNMVTLEGLGLGKVRDNYGIFDDDLESLKNIELELLIMYNLSLSDGMTELIDDKDKILNKQWHAAFDKKYNII